MRFVDLPEVFLSHVGMTHMISREMKKGKLRKIGPRLYTKNLKDIPEQIVKRHIWDIVSAYFPDGIIADRTALENKPAADGSIFLVSARIREVKLPGYTIRPRVGVPALDSDHKFIGNLHIAAQPRAFLENMKTSRARDRKISRTLSSRELENKLEDLLVKGGEGALNKIRDEAKKVAHRLNLEKEYQQLDNIIGTLLGTKTTLLTSKRSQARISGFPYDAERVNLFEILYQDLMKTAPQSRLRVKSKTSSNQNLAFYEAYFSNFIEGTEFEVEEAEDILFNGRIDINRPEDAHDILGTYQLVSSQEEMTKVYKSFEDFTQLLKKRHAVIMVGRKDKMPGEFKDKMNRAGSTVFVAPELVEGTLLKGFELLRSIEAPFHRAVFIMFVVAEVHPFLDGNGRLARVMMNAELVTNDEFPIIIPTVYRNNYLSALRALSQNKITEPLIRTLDFAQRYTAHIDWSDLKSARLQLTRTHAFTDPQTAELEGIRLRIE